MFDIISCDDEFSFLKRRCTIIMIAFFLYIQIFFLNIMKIIDFSLSVLIFYLRILPYTYDDFSLKSVDRKIMKLKAADRMILSILC